jgi:P27 family predicted phage terminase small subunit
MTRGRKPKPAELKILEGVRADRIPSGVATAVAGVPECPEHLDDDARAEWFRILPELQQLGVLSRTDGAALALYCDAYSQWVSANREIVTHGLMIETDLGGMKANPAVAMARAAKAQMHRLLVEFGCTPSSRGRISVSKAEPENALTELLRKRKKS